MQKMTGQLPKISYQRLVQQTPLARYRRHRRLMREFAAEAGITTPDITQRATLARAGTLALLLEDAERDAIAGKLPSADAIIRMNGELRRLRQELRTNAPQDQGTWQEKLAASLAEEDE
jgi:hypothetical protein